MRKKFTFNQKKLLDQLLSHKEIKEMKDVRISSFIYLIRKKLRMSQKQLAKRVGVPQSYISKLESGKVDPNLQTLKKIFQALFCYILIIPMPIEDLDQIIERKAQKIAKKRIEHLQGTMSLEKQDLDKKTLNELINEEKKDIIDSFSSNIWED